jgi:glutaminyl-tRNA synthetase
VRVVPGFLEPAAASLAPEASVQFERLGFFTADRRDHAPGRPVFNRTVTLRDTWAAKGGG